MRPGKQLFPLNYNNIINNKDIKYNIKYIKLIVKETYGGNRTYINQIMLYEETAEEVRDLLCGNELNKIYKMNKKLLGNHSSSQLNKKNSKKKISQNNKIINKNDYNSEQIIPKNKKQNIRNNEKKMKQQKNSKNYLCQKDESDIYKLSGINSKEENNEADYNQDELYMNYSKNSRRNNKLNNSRINEYKKIEITPVSKKPNRQIKTDIKNGNKNLKNIDKKDSLTPNKYLKRIKSLTNGNNTVNSNNTIQFGKNFGFDINDNVHIKRNFKNNLNQFDTSTDNNSIIDKNNVNDNMKYDEEEESENYEEEMNIQQQQQNLNSFNSGNEFGNTFSKIGIDKNNIINKQNSELEEDSISNIYNNKKRMNKTHENMHYNRKNNYFFNNITYNQKDNVIFPTPIPNKSNNTSFITEQNQNNTSNNNNNNYSQRHSIMAINNNYNNMKKYNDAQIKKKLDYLEGNILEIKKNLKEISEGFAFISSKEFIIRNFKEQILSVCEEIYDEYYQNNNTTVVNDKNGSESLITNSNYISQNNENSLELQLDNKINQKLDEKLGTIQNHIFDKYLKPTINKIGNTMKKNIEEIKLEVDNIDKNDSKQIINYNSNEISKEKEEDNLTNKLSTSKIRSEKFDEINKIGERLYNKLLEKEKKLKLLKIEKTKFLNERNLLEE